MCKAKTIWYEPVDSDWDAFVVVDQITHVTKSEPSISTDKTCTLIHLVNGQMLRSKCSMLTLRARIEGLGS